MKIKDGYCKNCNRAITFDQEILKYYHLWNGSIFCSMAAWLVKDFTRAAPKGGYESV